MNCFNKDEEWGFFIDLELDYENITKHPFYSCGKKTINKFNYLNTIYEEDYWYENEDENGENLKNNNDSEFYSPNINQKNQSTKIIMYCIFCASIISWSLIFV